MDSCGQSLGWRMGALVLVGLTLWPNAHATAQIYKYKKPDGTVVFTDALSELPPERRAYYNRKISEQKAREEQLEKGLSPSEKRAREREAQRAHLKAEKQSAELQKQRRAAINAALREIEREEQAEAQKQAYWLERFQQAETQLAEAVNTYQNAYEEWSAIAIKAQFALFPGQAQKRADLEAQLPRLVQAVDEANTYLTQTLPEAARKAGMPKRIWRR